MKTTTRTEQVASSVFRSQIGNMQTVVLVPLGLIFLISRTAGILAVAMLGINNMNYSAGSSNAKRSNKAMSTGNMEADPSSKTRKKAAKEPKKPNQQGQSPLFAALPAELRMEVYRNLLVSEYGGHILRPNKLIEENARKFRFTEYAKRQNGQWSLGIDSTFLRCCRRIYHEALPVLYGDNIFTFFQEHEISEFRSMEIMHTKGTKKKDIQLPIFNLRPCPEGRLSMICKLELKFRSRYPHSQTRMEFWEKFLLKQSDKDKVEDVRFPRLEMLLLDFEEWNLDWDHKVVIQPFVYMFRGGSGLKSLVVSGVENEDNLERFKRALLKEGGEFFPGYPPLQGQINSP